MAVGAKIRAMFGPYELLVSNLWRALFFNLDEWTATIKGWAPHPRRILEVGCGEGYSTARLAAAFPGVPIDAIDIAENIGRLYDGPADTVQFRIAFAEEIAAQHPGVYDIVILTDVLHHVPEAQRASLLASIRSLLSPDGILAFKDWHRAPVSPVHWLVHGADRWLTGDRVKYLKREEAAVLLTSVFGPATIRARTSISPWSNNYAFRVSNG